VSKYGYWALVLIIGGESMGLPLPGETMLVTAAIIAGSTHELNIVWVIAAAVAGGIMGDNLGYLLGRAFGHPLLLRYGRHLGLTDARIKLGQFLFDRHGGSVVFFGRFIAVLRAAAAVLAGVNYMPWHRFVVFNAAGAVAWATLYGMGAYLFGRQIERFTTPVALAAILIVVGGAVVVMRFVARHEAALTAAAEQAFPGPLRRASHESPSSTPRDGPPQP
jgi:membrane protein DedA with SNARE-associated domain